MKYYTTNGPRRELNVISIDTRNSLVTVQNSDGTTQDLKVKALYIEQ